MDTLNEISNQLPSSEGPYSQRLVPRPRLRSTAKYTNFQPSALATSKPSHPSIGAPSTSLGAISSKTNSSIILFNVVQPYEPLLVYHSTHNTSSSINLKFSNDSRLLAASYDSSILVYDCTGDALQPLLTRIVHGQGKREPIRCLHWSEGCGIKVGTGVNQGRNEYHNHLMTCSEHIVAQWDLRNPKKPSLSFDGDGYISVVTKENEIAALNSNGFVMVYDIRKNRMNSSTDHSYDDSDFIHRFRAHEVGVGIERMGRHLLTWGVDHTTAVKMWSPRNIQNHNDGAVAASTENYWYMGDGDVSTSKEDGKTDDMGVLHLRDTNNGQGCVAEIKVEDLSTVKVSSTLQRQSQMVSQCGFVTISTPNMDSDGHHANQSLWQADLWKATRSGDSAQSLCDSSPPKNAKVNRLATFQSGGSSDSHLAQMVGRDYAGGHIIAAELSLADFSQTSSEDKPNQERDRNNELILCCLTSNGYITTHAIHEASSFRGHEDNMNTKSPFRYHVGIHTNSESAVKIWGGVESEKNLNKLSIGKKAGKSDADLYFGGLNSTALELSFVTKGAIEGGTMQFDLDDEYEKEHDLVEPQVTSGDELGKELMDPNKSDVPIMNEIDPSKARRVPSPRLCGAVFSMDGKLMTFHNGNVKTMWKWYTSDYKQLAPSRRSQRIGFEDAVPTRGQSTFQRLEDEYLMSSDKSEDVSKDNGMTFPHSVWDLMKMNEAAKVAQWGNERDDEDGGENNSDSGPDSDESPTGDSDDSSESASEESFSETATSMYESYFGKTAELETPFDQPISDFSQPVPSLSKPFGPSSSMTRSRSGSYIGPTANLEPKVFSTDKIQEIAMNGQCPELADMWIFGPWEDSPKVVQSDDDSKLSEDIEQQQQVIHSRRKTGRYDMVAGLQKLYYHDMKGSSNTAVPLDQRVMQKEESARSRESSLASTRGEPYIDIINKSAKMRPDIVELISLRSRRDACLHNAKCAASIGQNGKSDVWKMLSEMLESIHIGLCDDFDGWYNIDGSALGRNLLLNVLRYYEAQGDIQMLATIVSVLGVGSKAGRVSSLDNSPRPFDLLRPEDTKRCNLYIHHYSSVLYSWGKLTTRAEINKYQTSTISRTLNKDIFVPYCHRCNRSANPETNVCQHCNEYAFRCSICTNAVRGLFTACILCGHGGHQNHMMAWFAERSVCPTGCGCNCILTTMIDSKSSQP